MTRAEHLREVYERHLAQCECLDRIEYVETTVDRSGRSSYIGWVRVLTRAAR